MKKKKLIVIMILCQIFFLGMIGNLIVMHFIDKKTEENTTEFEATISEVDIKNEGEDISIKIDTEEYGSLLYISPSISEKIDMNSINNLPKGQTIFFRIEDHMIEQFGEVYFCNIVSLRTTETEIISLTSYNTYIHDAAFPTRVAVGVLAGVFLSAFIYCIYRLKKIHN